MGGLNSCCIPRKTCDCGVTSMTSTPKGKGHKRNLSATFNLSVIEDNNKTPSNCLINVNAATEEELMTVPGINRALAKNIIDYRKHIGGFRCVEDVALASGVGADKLDQIRSDIYVVPSVISDASLDGYQASAINGGSSSLPVEEVNINTANVFTLLKLKGIGMTTAKNIVAYRDKHGKFTSVDELVKVKGIAAHTLEQIRPHILLEDKPRDKHNNKNGGVRTGSDANKSATSNGKVPRSTSSLEDLLQMLGPLSKIPQRPNVDRVTLKQGRRPVVRVASWNLERFTTAKAKNAGVRDVMCMTILENGFGIVACQELADKEALKEICEELNNPRLPNVKKWQGRGKWQYVVSEAAGRMFQSMEYLGFLYDASQNIEFVQGCLLNKSNDKEKKPFARMPYLGAFKFNKGFDFVLINVHLKATGMDNSDVSRTKQEVDTMDDVIEAVQDKIKDERDIIILGDFNLEPKSKAFDVLRGLGYTNCIQGDHNTNISVSNIQGSKNYDNIWISKYTEKVFTGVSGVVREGLYSHWIPHDWEWGGIISDHCPVFAQFFNQDLDNGDISSDDVEFVLGT